MYGIRDIIRERVEEHIPVFQKQVYFGWCRSHQKVHKCDNSQTQDFSDARSIIRLSSTGV